MADVEFVRVVDRGRPNLEFQIVVISVKGQQGLSGLAKNKFQVKNLEQQFNGTYIRRESGDENNEKID